MLMKRTERVDLTKKLPSNFIMVLIILIPILFNFQFFFLAATFFDVLEYFGELDEDVSLI